MAANDTPNSADLDWRDYIVCDAGVLGGKPTLKGTRLSIEFVLELLAGGWDQEAIRRNYPNLIEERIRAVNTYAERNTAPGNHS